MNVNDLQEIIEPTEIAGDTANFAAAAFSRAACAMPDFVDDGTLTEFVSFLESEAAEMYRQANYYASMVPYYDAAVAESRRYEAVAFVTMREHVLQHLSD